MADRGFDRQLSNFSFPKQVNDNCCLIYRLWCICKQPHNNRFMICCDGCEDWFHGKCVNITKAMGQAMEEQGIEWRCPNCIKKTPKAATKTASKDSKVNIILTIVYTQNKHRIILICIAHCIFTHYVDQYSLSVV